MKINLKDGRSICGNDPRYIYQEGPQGHECMVVAPDSPHYRCTRRIGHYGDHAAHGHGAVMFARWRAGKNDDVVP